MKLPDLLPRKLHFLSSAKRVSEVINALSGKPAYFILFFEFACSDETWAGQHAPLIVKMLERLTEQLYREYLSKEYTHRVLTAIQAHYNALRDIIPNTIDIVIEGQEFHANAFLLGAAGTVFKDIIAFEVYEKNNTKIPIRNLTIKEYPEFYEYITTGTLQNIWKQDESELLAIMLKASNFGLPGLARMAADVYKRYVNKTNVLQKIIDAHESFSLELKEVCYEVANESNMGVKFHPGEVNDFKVEFLDFSDLTMHLFEEVKGLITKISCHGRLPEDPAFGIILQNCPRLEALDISHTEDFSIQYEHIPKQILELDLSMCSWLTNPNLRKMFKLCPQIRSLNLTNNTQINFMGWGELLALRNLKHLNLSRCHQIGEEEIRLIVQAIKGITDLNIDECFKITEKGFFDLARGLARLQKLNLSRTTISDTALVEIGFRCKQLHVINLLRCERISDKGVHEFVKQAGQLSQINLSYSPISEGAIDSLSFLRPYLIIIKD